MENKLDILNQYYEDGLIYKQKHPTLPLIIWNYTQRVQYEKLWDDITLMCRGLITDDNGNIIVKPMTKFFNYEEVVYDANNLIPWKDNYVYVQDKLDGSMLILFHYLPTNEWVTATRGSFTSEQAIEGFRILNEKYKLETFEKSIAYIGEVIYPQNRIVVDYGNLSTVKFITAVPNRCYTWDNNNELHFTTAKSLFKVSGIKSKDIVKCEQYFTFGPDLPNKLKILDTKNSEGFIFRFHPSNFRMKIKFEEYIRLHRIITGVSNVAIWEYLMEGKPFEEMLDKVPDEFYDWVKKTEIDLKEEYTKIEGIYKLIYDKISNAYKSDDKKMFATYAKFYNNSAILFSMNTGKDYSKFIWKLIRPTFSKPFTNNQ
jgi:RNA ligase